MKVTVPKYVYENPYFWYFCRMLYILEKTEKIRIVKTNDKPLFTVYVAIVLIDGVPIILDVRDDASLPLPELKIYPNALIFKANYSSELWDNAPTTFEYPITDEERKYRKQIRPFIYGRAFGIPLEANERQAFRHCINQINKKVVSYTGTGVYRQQTESRLKVFDLINEVFSDKSKLIWYDRYDHYKNDWADYQVRRQKYLEKSPGAWDYENYLKFLSQGQYSLNIPGIAVSQPFRFIDGVLAGRGVISTKIWIDAWKSFPCNEIPICGYFGTGDWEKARLFLLRLEELEWDDTFLLKGMNKWYDHYLSADGMWNNQILKGINV